MLRQEVTEDYKEVERLTYSAYEGKHLLDFKQVVEDKQLEQVRQSDKFIPELSIVVQEGWEVTGHILLTEHIIQLENDEKLRTAKIEFMSVMPVLQKSGVGLQLIMQAADIAKKLDFTALSVTDEIEYFKKQHGFAPCNVPADMAQCILVKNI